jgi:glycosyltransferase involved in cell wall biosynthesis
MDPLPFRTVYVTSHVGPHPMHRALVRGVGADIARLDHFLRWIDVPRPKWQQYLSWLVNGWALPGREQWDLFVLEGFQIPAMLMKWMRRIAPSQKVICHHVGEQLYFMQTGFYSKSTDWGMRRIMRGYDAHIAVGEEQTRLVREVLGDAPAPVYTVYCTHVSADKYRRFTALQPGLESKRILFVGNIYGYWRIHYKGLDLLLDAFARASPELRLTLVGVHEPDYQRLTAPLPPSVVSRIELVKFAEDLAPYFATHALFLLPARGDAFPTVVLESAAAGVVPLVSEATGNKEVVERIAPELVAPLDAAEVARRIDRYFALPPEERQRLSARARAQAADFTEEKGVQRFREALLQIARDLGVTPRR